MNPREIIYQMMCHIGSESFAKGGEDHKTFAKEYFMMCEYGKKKYARKKIRELFGELESIASLYPNDGDHKLKDLHFKWRSEYYKHLFIRWSRNKGLG